jgi:opacity protein-like surface antigen
MKKVFALMAVCAGLAFLPASAAWAQTTSDQPAASATTHAAGGGSHRSHHRAKHRQTHKRARAGSAAASGKM